MPETVYIDQHFFCIDFAKMLREMRLLEAQLDDFCIELIFQGGGFDDHYWCSFKGIYVTGHRAKTETEIAVELAEAERQRLEQLERDAQRTHSIAKILLEQEQELAEELADAKARLEAFNKGDTNA